MWLMAMRELRSHLTGMGWWALAAAQCALLAWLMFAQLEVYQQIAPQLQAGSSLLGINALVVAPTLNSLSLLLILATPLLSMQSLAEERASGRFQVLLASPLGIARLLLGKWLGNGLAAWLLVALGVTIVGGLALGASVHVARVAVAALTLTMLVALAGALTLMWSAFTRHAASALAASYVLLLFAWLLDSLADTDSAWYALALNPHLSAGLQGRLDTSALVYFLAPTGAALLVAAVRLLIDRDPRLLSRWSGRLRLLLFSLLLLAGLGGAMALAERHPARLFDPRPPPSKMLLQAIEALRGPLSVSVYSAELPLLRAQIERLLEPLHEHYPAVQLHFIDPLAHPQLARQMGIQRQGEMTLEAMGRREHLARPSPRQLQRALGRLTRQGEPWIVTLGGFGEAGLDAAGGDGLSALARAVRQLGFQALQLDLKTTGQAPDNSALLLVAAPREPYPDQVVGLLKGYLAGGGHLLWLEEGAGSVALEAVTGVRLEAARPGLRASEAIGDLWQAAGVADQARPRLDSPLQLQLPDSGDWKIAGRLQSSDDGKPSVFGAALVRDIPPGPGRDRIKQASRLVVVGDSDFARNNLFADPANRALTLAMLNWLSDNRLASAPPADDLSLDWSPRTLALVAGVEILLLPLSLLAAGWWIRRKRLSGKPAAREARA